MTTTDTRVVDVSWDTLPELDHHSIVHNLIAERMHVKADGCRAHGLRLMIAPGEPAYIGFRRLSAENLGSNPEEVNSSASPSHLSGGVGIDES
jgi:hypothetical protein